MITALASVYLVFLTLASGSVTSKSFPPNREPHGNRLQVHIVPHSHDDCGWLKTFEQYYWGSRQNIHAAGVRYVLDSIVVALAADDRRRFSYAELSFFSHWWRHQNEETRRLVRKLVDEGRLTFVNGGYVQHDEAAAHFVAMVDQTTRGHRFLKKELNHTASVGWQIDPFGHSSTQAGLLGASLGFDAFFFGRADYQDMYKRRKHKQLEFIWQGTGDADADGGIFTGNFASGNYGPPPGFWWEWSNSPDPPMIEDGPESNVEERVETFVQRCLEVANVTRGRDIMLTMGSDFHYTAAHVWFSNLDLLIHHVNLDGRINAFYSSPADYIAAKHGYRTKWPVKSDDFFPYSDTPHSFWTGYFSSRASSKGFIRSGTSYLQAARQLEAYVGIDSDGASTDSLEQAVSFTQHHDAVTGTSKQHVANDYHLRLHAGMVEAQRVVHKALEKLMLGDEKTTTPSTLRRCVSSSVLLRTIEAWRLWLQSIASFVFGGGSVNNNISANGASLIDVNTLETVNERMEEQQPLGLQTCMWLNVSMCAPTVALSRRGDGIMVVAYNPLTWRREIVVRVPVSTDATCHFEVLGPDGTSIRSELVPVSTATRGLQALLTLVNATKESHAADAEVLFLAQLMPLGFAAFEVRPLERPDAGCPSASRSATVPCADVETGGRQLAKHGGTAANKASMGYRSLDLEPISEIAPPGTLQVSSSSKTAPVLTNGLVELEFDPKTGLISFMHLKNGPSTPLSVFFVWYNASDGLNVGEHCDRGQASGAYIFRPNGEYAVEPTTGRVQLEVHNGDLVSEARQTFADWATLSIRLYKNQKHAEFEWSVGPIPFEDGLGRDIALRFSTGLNSRSVFYTDANGRHMMRRERDYRPTWDLNVTEPIAGNYYPVTAAAVLRDEQDDAEFTVFTDRAQGASSLRSGELEFMVHRRTLVDDARGVGEALNETACGCSACDCPGLVVRGVHWVALSSSDTSGAMRRTLQQHLNDPPLLTFASVPSATLDDDHSLVREYSLVNGQETSPQAYVMTLMRPQDDPDKLLVRLAHLRQGSNRLTEGPASCNLNEQGEDVEVDLKNLLKGFGCSDTPPKELSLSTNQLARDARERRLRFQGGEGYLDTAGGCGIQGGPGSTGGAARELKWSGDKDKDGWMVRLRPMQVRTFEIEC